MAFASSLRNRKQGVSESKESSSLAQVQETQVPEDQNEAFRVTPLQERAVFTRLDVAPFFLLYCGLVALDTNTDSHLVTVILGVSLLLHMAVVLSAQWRVHAKVKVGYHFAAGKDTNQWTHCLVEPMNQTSDSSGIVPVRIFGETAIVNFHDHIFRYCSKPPDLDLVLWGDALTSKAHKDPQRFRPLYYPVNLPLQFYEKWTGHANIQSVTSAASVYGLNVTVLQLPSFLELLGEQVVAPFFLFQVFCVVLWSLDEYWYYALFTLVALLMFESTVAYNRLQSLQRLHHAGHKGDQRIYVQRGGVSKLRSSWMRIATRDLVPGDLVCLSGNNIPVPADILLVGGSAVCDEALLTGESVPQLKHCLDIGNKQDSHLNIQENEHKESILFGGTEILAVTPNEKSLTDSNVPVKGAIGIVLRTGFETAQGNLLRTMVHSSKSADGVHTWDTFVFIFALIICAVLAAGYVLEEGWHDERRNRFRLVLHVVIIVTSVVPPELPMELSLAVTNSVAALMKRCQVYCTEHFRIPLAGQVNVCCFDKTGTLTSDEMWLKGVRVFESDSPSSPEHDDFLIIPTEPVPWETLRIMAACHSLAVGTSHKGYGSVPVIGDPLEQAVFTCTGYILLNNNLVVPKEKGEKSRTMTILHRFAFSSKLKRMSVLVSEEGGQGKLLALVKGAPEQMKSFLSATSTPENYDDVSFHHMSRGRRVLAMAYRDAGLTRDLEKIIGNGREEIEKDLTFAGFLVLECPLKADSKSVITELRSSGHDTVMITGDAILTAVEVARKVGIIQRSAIHKVFQIVPRDLGESKSNQVDPLANLECIPVSGGTKETSALALSQNEMVAVFEKVRSGEIALCLSGDTLVKIAEFSLDIKDSKMRLSSVDEKHILLDPIAQRLLKQLIPMISVFGRHAPHQKEAVIAALNHAGYHTLMCGDGTNDVGALKRASVGISIISAPSVESKQREANATLAKIRGDQKRDRKNQRRTSKSHASALESSLRQLREAQEELDHVELGDASVAAPFTSRAVSIKCCKDVIQQGRCTLVTMLQIYKILGINCLVNAMVLSKLFLHGVKQGDRQLTILGIAVAALFYFVTRSEPLSTLSPIRPPATVLCAQALLSILAQFTIHFAALLVATEAALSFVDPYDPSLAPDGPFNPNSLNTCCFLLTCLSTINTFAVNYRGKPFMEDLSENVMLYRSLQVSYGIIFACALEVFPPLNDLMQLTPMPGTEDTAIHQSGPLTPVLSSIDFRILFVSIMVLDTILVFGVERAIVKLR